MNIIRINKKEIIIVLLCIIFWAFVQFIYEQALGSLGDQDLYIEAPTRDLSAFSNTLVTYNIYRFFRIFLPGRLSALVPILFTSIFLFRTLKVFYYNLPEYRKWILFSLFSLPHFWIWQAAASKEALMIPAGLVLSYYFAKYIYFGINRKEKIFILISYILIFALKPQFFLAYFVIGLSIFTKKIISLIREFRQYLRLSFNYYSFLFISGFTFLSYLILKFFRNILVENLENVMFLTQLHLLRNTEANTSRFDFYWISYKDFLENMIWGIPTSFLGFKFSEISDNFFYGLIFLEGCFSIILFFLLQFGLLRIGNNKKNIRFVYFLGILPAILLLVIIQYSSGIFNAGTAIRYKQNLIPILIYLPIYLIGFQQLTNIFKRNSS